MARRPRGLTPEERELWARVARTASAIHKSSTPEPEPVEKPKPAFKNEKPRRMSSVPVTLNSPPQRLTEPSLRMDHKLHKRMTKGKLAPEARLDLHGMTLAVAQPVLVNFIMSCRADRMRLVLVITGKGRGDHGPLPTRPGALRHIVPEWLRQAPLAAAVQQVTIAHFRHGGEGAYYVYLRKTS